MARLIVGDIHGCHEELLALVDRAGLAQDDEIVALGDLFDRGPEPGAVLSFFRERPNARSVLGNHERKHLLVRNRGCLAAPSQVAARELLGDAYGDALELMATLPPAIELPEAILVHGFWEPGRVLRGQSPSVLAGTRRSQAYIESRYGARWYERYDGPKPLVVGHLDYLHSGRPLIYRDRVFGIDTGCCHGRRLTGLVLPSFEIVSVPSRGDHWARVRQRLANRERRRGSRVAALAAADTAQALLRRIESGYRRIAVALEDPRRGQAPSDRDWSQLLARAVGKGPLLGLMHRVRIGDLDVGRLRRMVATPGRLDAVRRRLGEIEKGLA